MTAHSPPTTERAHSRASGRFQHLVDRAAWLVALRRVTDPNPDDPFRGLHTTDEEVDALLASPPPMDDGQDRLDVRLRQTARLFGLDAVDVQVLLTAAAPEWDPRFERVYGYLNDDVSRRRASVRVAIELLGGSVTSAGLRSRFDPAAPLVRARLLHVEDLDRPLLSRALRVPDRVVGHLLGADGVDACLQPLSAPAVAAHAPEGTRLAAALGRGVALCYLRERAGTSGRAVAVGACEQRGLGTLVLDLTGVHVGEVADVLALAARDAGLLGAALIAGPIDAVSAAPGWLAAAAWAPCPLLLVGRRSWDPTWCRRVPLIVDVETPPAEVRLAQWRDALAQRGLDTGLADAMGHVRLTPEQVERAVELARTNGDDAGTVAPAHLRAAARAVTPGRLEHLTTRVEAAGGFEELVAPADVLRALHALLARVRHGDRVLGDWGMGRAGGPGRGISALFTGPPGTGKTLSARVIAGELGLDLYLVDLATVVDKYIGETEKNLERIFDAAESINGVLLFDEADALFGKRSDVGDAKDRHANIEVAYLLQRMERFDGVAILTSNLRGNIDAAFNRRLDVVVAFPEPDEDLRAALWRAHLPPSLPLDADVDPAELARRFALTGGSIRNAALAAAYSAATDDRRVGMADLVVAVADEYRKLGRLCNAADFGAWSVATSGPGAA